jgi:hypothetical protein
MADLRMRRSWRLTRRGVALGGTRRRTVWGWPRRGSAPWETQGVGEVSDEAGSDDSGGDGKAGWPRVCENTGRHYSTRWGCGCEVCEP